MRQSETSMDDIEQFTSEIEQFKSDRNKAFLSLDELTIRAYMAKYEIQISQDKNVFWGSVHKAITGCSALPFEFRKASKAYLDAHGLRSLDDGDL